MAQFGIYIHWPFCESKCPYCDFNSHVGKSINHASWRQAYRTELFRYAAETSNRIVTSIFFGGGTPSLMDPETLAEIIKVIQDHWQVSNDLEVTMEANPSSAESRVLDAFRSAGVNRLSLGVQSLEDESLMILGRQHSAAEAIEAAKIVAQTFERYSLDFIYARPNQTVAGWSEELERALELAGDHISVYQLTIEPGTQFHKERVAPADEVLSVKLYEITQEILSEAGLLPYEISNHARPGQECSQNLLYWQGEDYVGLGPGAHGRLTGIAPNGSLKTEAIQEIRLPEKWLEAVQTKGVGTHKRNKLLFDQRRDELVLMGLRLSEGIDTERFFRLTGRRLFDNLEEDKLDRLVESGFLNRSCNNVRLTPRGLRCLDSVISALLV